MVDDAQNETSAETAVSETENADPPSTEKTEPTTPTSAEWSFPVRAAPILALQGEDVTEFPLSQHLSGHESTSVVLDDRLLRVVEARYDEDGIRRLNVRMALMKDHISGYSHTHLDLFQRLMPVWWISILSGVLMGTALFQGWLALSGGLFVFAGVAGLLMGKLDLHRISFSDRGGRHDFYLSGWRQHPVLIHNSTALLGPAFADFLRTGTIETNHIDAVVASMEVQSEPPTVAQASPQLPLTLPLPAPSVSSGTTPEAATPTPQSERVNQTNGHLQATTHPSPTNSSPQPLAPQPPGRSSLPSAPLPPPTNLVPPLPMPLNPPATALPSPPAVSHGPLPPAPIPPPPIRLTQQPLRTNEDALWDDLL